MKLIFRRDFIERLTNNEIRKLVSTTYFMDRIDRMTIELLNHYAFVIHEDVKKLTDKEIETARNYAENYLTESVHWKTYNSDFEFFVNRQKFNAMTNNDYNELEKLMYQVIRDINDINDIDDWKFDIYYGVDFGNKLLFARINDDEYKERIDLIYNIDTRTFSTSDIALSEDMYKLGTIDYNSYSFYELYNVKI